MRIANHLIPVVAAVAMQIAAVAPVVAQPTKNIAIAAHKPKVQLALLLDTSNSMDGLIEQAKSELWSVVNRMSRAERRGVKPDIEVALYEYGNDGLAAGEGYLRMVSPFTSDLDALSEELFALRTNGGSEYCGMAIDRAVEGLDWSRTPGDYQAIFIAGNEHFTQGPVNFESAIRKAVGRGIVVNTIHCGDERAGQDGMWAQAARLGEGRYMAINHNTRQIHIATPYDDELTRLSSKLNETYIGYGREGSKKMARQRAQDSNASTMGRRSSVARAVTKGGGAYKNSSWDLVDRADEEGAIDDIAAEVLPAEMRKMNKKERRAYVATKAKERKAIQKRIRDLDGKRRAYVAKSRKNKASKKTLDKAMLDAVDTQMRASGFNFK